MSIYEGIKVVSNYHSVVIIFYISFSSIYLFFVLLAINWEKKYFCVNCLNKDNWLFVLRIPRILSKTSNPRGSFSTMRPFHYMSLFFRCFPLYAEMHLIKKHLFIGSIIINIISPLGQS